MQEKKITTISIFFLILLAVSPAPVHADNPYLELMNRFVSGVTNTHGSLQDRLIEGGIETPVPEADEEKACIRRSAAKYLMTSDREESRKYWKDIERGIQDVVQNNGVTDQAQTEIYRKNTNDLRKCRIVNYGKPPGIIDVERGCFNRQCSEISGEFSVNMGWGISGSGEGAMTPVDMSVTVQGDRAVVHQSGFQTLNWFENVTVIRKGDILIFSHDDKTTFAMGTQENLEPVANHLFFGAKGEYFSLMLPPDAKSRAIVHFGILEPENELRRVCK
ncbi:hypothetical protein DENIS_0667 [Desulfonema ishimotonii]|uniref:Uncharacterized protein n=1 Tax=Desulfonema ishimotonii TaxID=45657 RepID=A0A401FRY9_9BACT|nr:hypothetical protein [Desulfonema ishimotonii]GBC59726.1 hypothetical protein DENIS_0667 [Desulfonema ishimotonii]